MTVKNRIVMTAAEFTLDEMSGKPTERLTDYYEERTDGGVGMITPGICRVNDLAGAATDTRLSMSRTPTSDPCANSHPASTGTVQSSVSNSTTPVRSVSRTIEKGRLNRFLARKAEAEQQT